MTALAKTIAANLHAARIGAGLSQRAVADRVGASCAAVSNWERATGEISAANLLAVSDALGVPLLWLLGREGGGDDDAAYRAGWDDCEAVVTRALKDARAEP